MEPKILILGATGGIGYAVTDNLLKQGIPVAILVRSKHKANALFGNTELLTVHEGDVQDTKLLERISREKEFIFHGVNYPYTDWFGNIDTATQKIIDAAAINNATIIYPGSVYNFGNTRTPIDEETLARPCSRKGALRVQLEEMMENAVLDGKCKVLIVRLPDFWGPNVVNHGTIPIFENALKKKPIYYIGNATLRHQFVYTKDAAEIIVGLIQIHAQLKPFEVINYAGETFSSASAFLHAVADNAGSARRVKVLTRPFISILAWFVPVMRELKEMLYLFENAVLLDDSKLRKMFPTFKPTPLPKAITETLHWFNQNRVKI